MSIISTNFIFDVLETDITDKSGNIDNNIFMQNIFGENLYNISPIIVSFSGNPNTIHNKNWNGFAWSKELTVNSQNNNYFSLATYKKNDSGKYRRKKSQFQTLHAVMLDDIGTKISFEQIKLKPSWILETSSGNFQIGYIFETPISDIKLADQLMKAIVIAKLCDPGASGPATRLARLPVAVNGKHEPQFQCHLKAWNPNIRYSVDKLIDGLQIELAEKNKTKSNKNKTEKFYDEEDIQILTPSPKDNPVLIALKKRALYKLKLDEGKHDITCPWLHEHTSSINSGTAYFEPDNKYHIGGFKCQHGHCSERNIKDLLDFLKINVTSARNKSTIKIIKGELNNIVDIAERELAATKIYYQRGGIIVSIYMDKNTKQTLIQAVTTSSLIRTLSDIAIWEQYDGRSKSWVRIDPPARYVAILFDSNNYQHLPVINGLARQPYLRPNKSLMKQPGYDLDTGMFGVFDGKKFLIPDKPSFDDAKEALKILNELLDEFCFVNDEDKSAAISAILTAAIRPSIINAPMIHVRAHTVGSGKSYLCALITAFASPQQGTPTTFPADDEECRKLLLAELLRSPAVIEFDNMTSDILPHKSLCTALTSEFMTGRILGVSKTATVNTRVLFLSSGNNVTPIKDMTRRCVTINLNPEVETPATRTFKRPNLVAEVLKDRERYVSAAITIIRAWFVAKKPKTKCKPLAGFNDWSEICRQPILWLGCADPATSIFEAMKEDPDREQLGRLLVIWKNTFGNIPTMVRDAVNMSILSGNEELKEILHDIADERGNINRRRLGRWIKRHQGQIVDGLRFERCSGNTSAEKWKVISVLSVNNDNNQKNANSAQAYLNASKGE